MAQQQMTLPPIDSSIEDYAAMLRNQRLAQALNQEANSPIDYDQRGFISPAQILAKGLAGIGANFANKKVDEDTARAAIAKQQQMQQMFGATPQALGAALSGQYPTQSNPLSRGFANNQQALFFAQNFPDIYKEVAGKNMQLTENQKNYGSQLGALNDATIAEKQAQAAKAAWLDMNAGNTATNTMTGQQIGANKLIENDLGNAKQTLLANPLSGQNQILRTDLKGISPDTLAHTQGTGIGGLSEAAKDLLAERLLQGEKGNILGNLGRGAQGAADLRDIQNRVAQRAVDRGLDAAKILANTQNVIADNRTFTELGAREGKIAPRVQEAQNFANIAIQASSNVPRGQFMPWNKLSQASDTALSDPNLATMKAATNSLVNAYSAAISGGVPTVHDKEQAEKMLNTAQSPEAYQAVVNQLIKETQAALNSPKQVREQMHSSGKPDQNQNGNASEKEIFESYGIKP